MLRKNIKTFSIIFLLAALVFFSRIVPAMELEESTAYASFIKDVIDSTTLEKRGAFCAIGNDEVARALAIQNPKLVRIDDTSKKYDHCNVMYVSQGAERGLRIELDRLAEKKILTIAIFDGFTNMGGMIQVQLGRRNFELTVNSKLLKTAGVRLDVLATNLIIN